MYLAIFELVRVGFLVLFLNLEWKFWGGLFFVGYSGKANVVFGGGSRAVRRSKQMRVLVHRTGTSTSIEPSNYVRDSVFLCYQLST